MRTSKARLRRTIGTIGVVVVTVGAAACDEEGSGTSIDSTEEFCASIKDVDERFDAADSESSDFDDFQAQYREINERLEVLLSAIDVVDEPDRDAVEATLDWGHDLTEVVLDAESQTELEEQMFADDGIFARGEQIDPAGEAWISDTCGVDLDDEG